MNEENLLGEECWRSVGCLLVECVLLLLLVLKKLKLMRIRWRERRWSFYRDYQLIQMYPSCLSRNAARGPQKSTSETSIVFRNTLSSGQQQ